MKHGHASESGWSPTYIVWHSMLARCRDAFRNDHDRYFGKGIRVCDRWRGRDGFAHFLEDMGERPVDVEATARKGRTVYMTLDRKDARADYGPDTCRWATVSQQNTGLRRKNDQQLTAGGVTRTIAEWADEVGVKYESMLRRLQRGWTPAEACSVRYRRQRRTSAVAAAREV